MKGKAGRQKQSRKRPEKALKRSKARETPQGRRKAENGRKWAADRQAANDQSGQAVTDHHGRKPPEL